MPHKRFAVVIVAVLVMSGCGNERVAVVDSPTTTADTWIGAWQYMYVNAEGLIVSEEPVWIDDFATQQADKKILFTPEGTWQHSHDDNTGAYVVFGNRFRIEEKTGSWVLDGNILKLAYDNEPIQILKKTESFEEYIPPPPRLPEATTVTIFPAHESKVSPNTNIRLGFNEAVARVTVNGTAATGSEKIWRLNLESLKLPLGRNRLKIEWVNFIGTTGSASAVLVIVPQESD